MPRATPRSPPKHPLGKNGTDAAARGQGQGAGRLLLAALITESETNGIWTLQTGIFPENSASLRAHAGAGFREVGRRERIGQMHGTWHGTWHGTRLLERRGTVTGVAPARA